VSTNLLFSPAVRSAETLRARFEINSLVSLGLACAFLGTGSAKVAATDFVIETFQGSTLPAWMVVAIGLLEITAAVMTIIPTTRLLGAALLSSVMMGAIGYHVARGEWLLMSIPLAGFALSLLTLGLELSLRRAEARLRTVPVR
jgi:uncharacterized membrane protein YphA (DoxX/SURF4 family)